MNLAYLISAHTDPQQLRRLICSLQPEAHFFIHIDKKSDIQPFMSIIKGDNIHFLSDRIDVRWGTILEVEYQMALIKAAVDHPTTFGRIFFISGMDYPLWSNEKISQWAENLGDKEVLCGMNMNTPLLSRQQHELYSTPRPFFSSAWLSNKGNQRLSIICRTIKKHLGMRKPLAFTVEGKEWNLYKGSAWWCISETLAAYVLDVYEHKPEVLRYFTDSFGQAETLIQTIAFNSEAWKDRCMLHEGAYPGLAALTPLHYIIYEPVIKVMDETDYDTLISSGRMFTRKLTSGKSDKLVKLLDEHRGE